MKKVFSIFLKAVLVILAIIVMGAVFLVGRWLVRHEDPLAFLPDHYVAFIQVPSLRVLYNDWLNLSAADVVLSRPELVSYRSALSDARGLALAKSPIVQKLLDVHADIVLLPDQKLLAVLDLGWRGILSPLARVAGPMLSIKGFSFLNESGTPLYRFSSGNATVQAALIENVAVIALDEGVLKDALARRASGQGIAAVASRDLVQRLRPRNGRAVRVLVDTQSLAADLMGVNALGSRVLAALRLPGQSALEAEANAESLRLSSEMPVAASLPELAKVMSYSPRPVGVLRYVPSSAYMLSVVNAAPLEDLYHLVAVLEGGSFQDLYKKADDGARSLLGAGIQELVFSWIGSEIGAFQLSGSGEPVYFARIDDSKAFASAVGKLTSSAVAGKDSSLVLDGVRVDKLSIPWYVSMILGAFGVSVPEPYFLTRGDYVFVSLDPGNLASVVKTADTGDNIARAGSFPRLTERVPADASLMVWYDSSRAQPFFLSGSGILPDVLRLYGSGVVVARVSASRLSVTLLAATGDRGMAQPLAGFPLTVEGGVNGDLLAFRFSDSGPALLAWVRDRSTLVLADSSGARVADARLDADSVIVPEQLRPGVLSAVWAVSAGGTVWRFGPKLEERAPFPVATAIASPMPPVLLGGKLGLYSRADSALVVIGPDGSRAVCGAALDSPLLTAPDSLGDRMTFYPRSFDAKVHLRDLSGAEAPGWPVSAAGISFCAPRFVPTGGSFRVVFLTQAGVLYAWDPGGSAAAGFPMTLPGVYYATPEPLAVDGQSALVALAQDGTLSIIGMNGAVLRQTVVPDLDGKNARILAADLYQDGRQEILLYGSGAFIAGYDSSLRPLPGFPLKGVSRPQLLELNHDGRLDLVSAGLDGKIYAYALGKGRK
ncbi:MAG: hypothetical protein ACLQCB_15635 [Spirochaetia bacterium]